MVLLLGVSATCLQRYGGFVKDRLPSLYPDLSQDLWTPESQVTLVHRLGVLEYIAFTYAAGDGMVPLASGRVWTAEGDQLGKATREFVNVGSRYSSRLAPNIVFFHAESTFDPNDIFKLSERVDLSLWSRGRATRAIGPLRVNVVGGGSWVTEFEVMTGVDSRLFGYQGFYTHQYLAPMVRNSFPKYLARKGYRTTVYYPVDGSFYNAAVAFAAYGMEEFIDGPALGLPADWAQNRRPRHGGGHRPPGRLRASGAILLFHQYDRESRSARLSERRRRGTRFSGEVPTGRVGRADVLAARIPAARRVDVGGVRARGGGTARDRKTHGTALRPARVRRPPAVVVH